MRPAWEPPTDDELAALDAHAAQRPVDGRGPRRQADQPGQGALSRPRTASRPVTKRELVRYYARSRRCCCPTSPGARSTCTATPTGVDRPGFWQQELPAGAPEWVTRWHNPEADPGETECRVSSSTASPTLAWLANFAAVELHPWTGRLPDVAPADLGADRHRPGDADAVRPTSSCSPGCSAPRWSTSASPAMPKVTGQRGIQIWVPVRARLHLRRHAGLGGEGVEGGRAAPCPSW